MTSPPPRPEGIPTGRILSWIIVAVLVIGGLYLYFRYGRQITPALGLLA